MVPNCVPVKNAKERFESYTDYPESATAAAKRALEWRDAHPDQGCGTPVGWARANQLAKREPISEETIARMASFARHKQNSETPYSEGCGGLMWDAWGGTAGIEWASNKLEKIRTEMQEMYPNLDVLGYRTKYFYMCPGALGTFEHLVSMNPDEDTAGMIRSAAAIADRVFEIEKTVLENGIATIEDFTEASVLVKDMFDIFREVDARLGMTHDIDYMYTHLEIIADLVPEEEFEIVTESLPPYVDEITKEKEEREIIKIIKAADPELFAAVTGFLTRGLTREEVLKAGFRNGTKLYRYDKAGSGEPGRSFCESIEGRYFRRFAIDALKPYNTEFGHNRQEYSIWNYKGGPNCVHAWREFEYNKREGNVELTDNGFVSGLPGTPPKEMANNGYYSPETKRKSEIAYIVSQQNMSSELERYHFNEEQRVVTGPLMIPSMEIPRRAEDGSKYYVYFTEDTIRQIAEKFLREKKVDQTNIEHDSDDIRTNNYLYESWIVEDPEMDKAKALGFSVPKGTWMGSMRVMDDTTWKLVKDGKIKGFSVEGFFGEMQEKKKFYSMRACPMPTRDLELNTVNRNRAIKAPFIEYGPLNVDKPEGYWEHLAEHWGTSVEAAKASTCGNCAAFDISPRMDECMPGVTSDKDGVLGYCWMHHFKCHSARSCYTWAAGGPITEDEVSYEWQARNLEAAGNPNPIQ